MRHFLAVALTLAMGVTTLAGNIENPGINGNIENPGITSIIIDLVSLCI